MDRLDSTGFSFSGSDCQLDESYCSIDESLEDVGSTLDLELPDGRINSSGWCRVRLSVSPLLWQRDHFKVRLATNHYSFTLGRSVTIRTFKSFIYIQNSLRELSPYAAIPSLPSRFTFCLYSTQRQCELLAVFLREVISTREHLSNRALHLFLQTNLSLEDIKLNIQGLRDDDVPDFPLVDKRNNSKGGFAEIFV